MTLDEKKLLDASTNGKVAVIEKLLKAGVDVNAKDERGLPKHRTSLMHAAASGHHNAVDLLLRHGAKVNAVDKGFPIDCPGGNTALILTIQAGHVEVAYRLLDDGASSRKKGGGTTVLCAAADLGEINLMKRLLASEADPNQAGSDGFNPIASAIQKGHEAIVRLLLAAGVSPNAPGPNQNPILNIAVAQGFLEICQLLVESGANPNLAGVDGSTPLMTAVLHAREEMVEFLLALGADVNARDERGRTALDLLNWLSAPPDLAPEIIQRLIEMGEDMGPPRKLVNAIARLLDNAGAKAAKEIESASQ